MIERARLARRFAFRSSITGRCCGGYPAGAAAMACLTTDTERLRASRRAAEALEPVSHGLTAGNRTGGVNVAEFAVLQSADRRTDSKRGHGETRCRAHLAFRRSPTKGALVSNKSLTIVLPVYNGESKLTGCVNELLELASELTNRFSILVVDDGSTDDTSAVVQSLSARYPQVSLCRHRQRRGLGPIITMVQRRVSSDVVIVHDGVTPIDTVQVRRLWQQSNASTTVAAEAVRHPRCCRCRATHDAMARVHGRVLGFHLLEPLREAESAGRAGCRVEQSPRTE